ncbi:hypothetical protein BT69DRAFT_786938 [Atractiella rhizophila]|nr:hypothetical protein BT69DRAFT_786938 [Atractiella rhizophila]
MAALMEATQGSEWDSKNVQQPTAAKTNPASGIQEMLVASVMNQPSIQREKLLKTSSAIAGKYGEGIIAPTPAPINMTDVGTGTLSSSYGAYMPASGPYPELRTPSPSSISSHELSHHIQVENNLFDPPDLTEQDREFVQHSMFFSGFDSMFSDFHPSAILAPWDPFAFGSSRPVVELPLDGFLQDIEREAMNSTRLPAIVEIDGAETDSPPNQGEGEGQRNQGTQTVDATSHPAAPVHPWDPNFHPPLAFPLSNFDYSLGVTVTPDRFKQQHAELPPVDPVLPIEENRRSSSPESTGSSSPSSRHSTTSSTRLAVWHPPLLPPVFPEPIETTAATTMWGYNQPANQDHHGSAIQAFVSQKEDAPSTVEAIPAPQTEKRTQKKHKNPHATQAPMHVSASDSRPQCSNCGAYQTPLWRRGNNEELLCNACGLYLKLHKTHRPKSFGHKAPAAAPAAKHHHAPASSSTSTTTTSAPPPRKMTAEGPVHCKNCKADQTPMWRKVDGQLLCNACALYAKMHKAPQGCTSNRQPSTLGERREGRTAYSWLETSRTTSEHELEGDGQRGSSGSENLRLSASLLFPRWYR